MMTRGGRKPGQEEQPDEGVGALSELEAMAATSPEDKLEELTGLVKSLMRSQAARDQKWEKDLSRQEQRWKGMQHQFQQIQLQVNTVIDKPDPPEAPAHPTTSEEQEHGFNGEDIPVTSGSRSLIVPKLFPLSTEDDIEHFLTTFERMANVCRWPRDEWAFRLVPLLTGKARTAYILMDLTDSENYDKVKEAILAKYEIIADTYRRCFRSLNVEPGETPRELYVRLKDLFSRWIKPEKSTVEEISEQIILEQFLRMVNPELEIWIREHDPKTAKEAASLAEVFTSARKGSKSTYFSRETHYAQPKGVCQGQVSCLADTVYLIKGGILYQRKGKCEAVALPQQFRNKVMDLGHSIPWAGHMAFYKTLNRISSHFVWPGMYVEVSEFCRSCEKCPLTSGKGLAQAQLQALPIIETPFERLGMDIVGPLERSSTGHRYILVICDYATRFPEAFPFRSIKARYIANCLLQLFSRVGIPREILTDCGTNFLSKLLQQVYKLLGIKGLKTTLYHPQTDGLVERYKQTLKSMLRKFVSDTGADWDQWLPYLLFAYREVPQVSTGFSSFDCWEDPKADGENIAAYVITTRERLEKMAPLVQDNMKAAQKHQKTWYDQKARDRVFLPGQKVLLLLTTSDNKLLTKWHGPYEIVRQLFRETPGFTSLVQHKIQVKEDAPVRQKSYRIPERYLNAVSKFDPYPMPRVDDLLKRVGSARYITTLDLCKRYWQVALAPEVKELTAFKNSFWYVPI
ncbi:hypothetical protein ACER0C_002430 [Sarotherodon galilaeus]